MNLNTLTSCQILSIVLLGVTLLVLFTRSSDSREGFCNNCGSAETCGCGIIARDDDYSTCYKQKKIYLNSDDCDEKFGHGDAMLEKRWGKLYITLNANLPYAQGGVMHTMWGAYHALLIDSDGNEPEVYLGSLVRHGDRFYKLSTELLGDYRAYDKIMVLRKTEDYPPVTVLKGSLTKQHCTSL